MNTDWTGFNRNGIQATWRHFKLFVKVLLFVLVVVVVALVCGDLLDRSDLSVLTEAGQAKEARYQEWKTREVENRARQDERDEFRHRYENETR